VNALRRVRGDEVEIKKSNARRSSLIHFERVRLDTRFPALPTSVIFVGVMYTAWWNTGGTGSDI
jgi:hypothetical protein